MEYLGDSTETSPSWASATSSAMETPNDVDQPLAFDFSRKCEVNTDGRQQLVLPKSRVRNRLWILNHLSGLYVSVHAPDWNI